MKRLSIAVLAIIGLSLNACSQANRALQIAGDIPSLRANVRKPIASIQIQLPAARLALGQTLTFAVVAKTAAGVAITGAYDHPIVLSAAHLTFVPASIANGTQAQAVTATWAAGFDGGVSDAISAAADGKTANAPLAPGTGFAYYIVGSNPAYDTGGFMLTYGPDGNVYAGVLGPTVCNPTTGFCQANDGAVVQLNPATGVATQIELHSEPVGLFFSSDKALWIAGGGTNTIFRLPPGKFSAAELQTIPVSTPPTGTGFPRMLAQDGQGNIWISDKLGRRLLKIPMAGPYETSAIAAYPLPNGPAGTIMSSGSPDGIAYGVDGKIYALDFHNGLVDQVDPKTGATTAQLLMPQQKVLGGNDSAAPRFLTQTSGGRMFFSFLGTFGGTTPAPIPGIDSFVPPGPAMKNVRIFSPPSGSQPDPIQANGSLVYYADLFGALGYVDSKSGRTRLFPTQPYTAPNAYHVPDGVTVLPDGTAWFTCDNVTSPLLPQCLGHTVYMKGWSVFPGPSFVLWKGSAYSQGIGIMESPAANSGPFKATTTAKCSISAITDHNFYVTGKALGACNVIVTDAKNTSQTVTISVQTPPPPPGSAARRRLPLP